MSDALEFAIGSAVVGSDGPCGELRWVVVDPVARALTHLVVEPSGEQGSGRLVPIDLVESGGAEIRLRCSMAEFRELVIAEDTQFLPGADGDWQYEQAQMRSLPYYALGVGFSGLGGLGPAIGQGLSMGSRPADPVGSSSQSITEHRVPDGEVEIQRGEHVHATDGEIGQIHGFIVDPTDHRLTHVLLEEGHLWGKKQVAIPISAVTGVENGVHLSLSKHDVGDLPPVDLAAPQ